MPPKKCKNLFFKLSMKTKISTASAASIFSHLCKITQSRPALTTAFTKSKHQMANPPSNSKSKLKPWPFVTKLYHTILKTKKEEKNHHPHLNQTHTQTQKQTDPKSQTYPQSTSNHKASPDIASNTVWFLPV